MKAVIALSTLSPSTFRFRSVSLVPSQRAKDHELYFVIEYPTQSIPACYSRVRCGLTNLSGRGLDRLDEDPEALDVAVDHIHPEAAPEAATTIEEASAVLVRP